jgi:U3 small nucleolar RNA-associated protein 4
VVWIAPIIESDLDDSADSDSDSDLSPALHKNPARKQSESVRQGNRLISAGLDGYITEYDLTTCAPSSRVESGGGAIWCMAASPAKGGHEIAVGCEDGCVRIFSTVGGDDFTDIEYKCTFDRQDGKPNITIIVMKIT